MARARDLLCATAALICLTVPATTAHREHKVHNIVLYPDKHSWCKTTPIKQVVAYPGCNSVEIDNNVCVGACFSYSIPRTTPSAPGELIKPYCDSCQPSEVTWQHVSLDCNGQEMSERVQMIENCSCSTCDVVHDNLGIQSQASGDDEIFRQPSLLPNNDLIKDFMNPHNPRKHSNESSNHTLITNDPVLNEKLLLLLKQFNGEDSVEDSPDFDKTALQELLKQVEGVDHRVNQVTLGKLLKHVEDTEHIKVDIASLRHILARLAHDQIEGDVPVIPHHELHRHHQHNHHHSGHHLSVESHHPHHEVADTPALLHEAHSFDTASPALLEADEAPEEELDPTLDVAPHHLKPALEGTVLSYHENILPTEDEEDTDKTGGDFP